MSTLEVPSTIHHTAEPERWAIETHDLQKHYGTVKAVDGVSLRVERGTIYALLGPNGAGKTTTINLLTTLGLPTGGSARVLGLDVVAEANEIRQKIGVTFQESVIDKNLSGRLVLDIHGRLYRLPKAQIKARIAELVELVELKDAIDRPVKTYSGGMKRRLELARGLMTQPQLLFLDEPTLGLDPQNRDRIWEYIYDLNKSDGLTILVTTHYMDEAEKLADRVGIIDGGKIITEGTPAELVATMGADVVSVVGQGDPTDALTALKEQEWVSFVDRPTETTETADKPNPELQIGLKTEAGRSLKPIIDLVEQHGFKVLDISIKRPSLNDVFLKYTGRRLRD